MWSCATADSVHAQRSYLTVTQLSHLLNGDPPLHIYKIIFNYEAVISLQQKETNFFILKLIFSLIRDFLSFSKKVIREKLRTNRESRIANH